jgi:FAD binding domain
MIKPDQRADVSVAIVGAGLSGLCLAQSLHRVGFDVEVYERDPSAHARRQGYRIMLDKHGENALRKCLPSHLFEAVADTASSVDDVGYFRFTNQRLDEIFKLTFKPEQRGQDQQTFGQVDRSTLRTVMLSGLEDRIHFDKCVEYVDELSDGVTIRFTDGSSTHASLVVGADGVHSKIREQLLPDCQIVDTGSRGIYGKTPLITGGKSLVPDMLKNSGVLALAGFGRAFFFTSMRFNNSPKDIFARLELNQEPPVDDDYVMWALLFPKEELPPDVFSSARNPCIA